MNITTVGIDLAKCVFQIHGVNKHGKAVLRKQLRRQQMAEFFANMPPCLIGMEACGSAHHWARKLQAMGHTVRLMAPQFVKPYVKTNKNDAADAEAICEAVTRPNMRFVPIKNVEQQAVLALHRARQGFVTARTAQANQVRGLLAEYGLVIPQGFATLALRVPELLEGAANSIARSKRSRRRSSPGIETAPSAANWPPSPEWVRSRRVRWLPPWATPKASPVADSWRRGWDWCRGRTPAAARMCCWVSASVATPIYVPC